jgi:tetratricopeptide (TPR) repeat protein
MPKVGITFASALHISFVLVIAWTAAAQQTSRPQAAQPTVQQLHALIHAGKFEEFAKKVDALDAQDLNWKGVVELFIEAGEQQGDYAYVKGKAKHVVDVNRDPETRATAAFAVATAYWRSGQLREAEGAFGEVAKILPNSDLAQAATGNIHEIKDLAIGQRCPPFTAQATTGERVGPDEMRGKIVLLHFWASW